eukprot:scaffold7204_cov354-Prasinococcus_capsulatus_cf.AAC.2
MRVSDAGSAKSAASCAVIPVLNRTFLGDAVASDERVALTAHMEVRAAVYNLPACRRSHTQPPSPRFVSGREEAPKAADEVQVELPETPAHERKYGAGHVGQPLTPKGSTDIVLRILEAAAGPSSLYYRLCQFHECCFWG